MSEAHFDPSSFLHIGAKERHLFDDENALLELEERIREVNNNLADARQMMHVARLDPKISEESRRELTANFKGIINDYEEALCGYYTESTKARRQLTFTEQLFSDDNDAENSLM